MGWCGCHSLQLSRALPRVCWYCPLCVDCVFVYQALRCPLRGAVCRWVFASQGARAMTETEVEKREELLCLERTSLNGLVPLLPVV